MPWNRNAPDPLDAKRRQLAEQERALSEQMSRLTQQLHHSGELLPEESKPEPPVWRMEDDGSSQRAVEPTPARKRNLARQRQRDMILFFIFIAVFLIVAGIVLWLAYVHTTALTNGA